MFGQVRTFYERIEPVAESFPDLDPKIDMRWDDTEGGKTEFTGFHRIERFLWPPQAGDRRQGRQVSPDDAADAKAKDNAQSIGVIADGLAQGRHHLLKDELGKPDFSFETRMFVARPQALTTRSPPPRSTVRRTATRTPTCGTSPPTSTVPKR